MKRFFASVVVSFLCASPAFADQIIESEVGELTARVKYQREGMCRNAFNLASIDVTRLLIEIARNPLHAYPACIQATIAYNQKYPTNSEQRKFAVIDFDDDGGHVVTDHHLGPACVARQYQSQIQTDCTVQVVE